MHGEDTDEGQLERRSFMGVVAAGPAAIGASGCGGVAGPGFRARA
jgi:hypothetical protein